MIAIWKRLPTSASTLLMLLAFLRPAHANPPAPDLNSWRGPCFNCYNYGVNSKSAFFAQPGGPPTNVKDCPSVIAEAEADGLVRKHWKAGDPVPSCGDDSCLVALVLRPGVDYHWIRRNADGSWSQKHGELEAIDTDDGVAAAAPGGDRGAAMAMTDNANPPHAALAAGRIALSETQNYTEFCDYFCFKAPSLTGLQSWTLTDLIRSWILRRSGLGNIFTDLTDLFAISSLASHLPGTADSVPDPHWSKSVPQGYALAPGAGISPGLGFPPYLRVFQGTVGYYSDLDGTHITFYRDDHGLEATLASMLATPVEVSNISVDAGDGFVSVTWTALAGASARFQVLRSDGSEGSFRPVTGEIGGSADQSRFAFRDTDVKPASEYFYKIGYRGNGGWSYFGPMRVRTSPARFAIRGIEPNPTTGATRIEYEVSLGGELRLGVYDITGRLVRSLIHGTVGAGLGSAQWDGRRADGARAPDGTYFIRLTSGSRTLSRKLVLVR